MRRAWLVPGLLVLSLGALACSDGAATAEQSGAGSAAGSSTKVGSGGTSGSATSGAGGTENGGAAGTSTAGAAGTSTAGSGGAGAGSGGATAGTGGQASAAIDEVEPNGGASLAEVNPFVVGTPVNGAIGSANDADIFKLAATPGKVYVVRLTRPAGSALAAHLAVFDAGRGKKNAGEDYVKIATAKGAANEAIVELLAMGEGGYLIGVRDERNVDDPKKALGDATFTYQINVTELAATERVRGPLALPGKVEGSFDSPGALHLYAFDVTDGLELTADFSPNGGAKDLDGRFFVYSDTTKDWAARNDNRSESNHSPSFDKVPLQPAGAAYLVVENIEPTAITLGYTITSAAASSGP